MSHFGLGLIAGQGTPGNDAFTKILLHFDGANGSTTFTDSNAGGSAHTWATYVSGDALNTSVVKFGTASLKTATNSGINTNNHSDFNLAALDWTIDFWWNPLGVSGGGFQGLFGQSDASTVSGLYCYRDNSNKIIFSASGMTSGLVSSASIAGNQWYHLAFVRNGNNIKLFVDGVVDQSVSSSGTVGYNGSHKFGIGVTGAQSPASTSKHFDEFRLSVGIARWTANFTPPIAAYT